MHSQLNSIASAVMIEMGCWHERKPVFIMFAVDIAFGAMNALIKKAIDGGMNCLILITLRQLVATLFMAPIAYFQERETRAKLTSGIVVYLFLSALLGATLTQYLFYVGMQFTSATFACAFLNMVPVFTFLIALPFRLETLNLKSKAGIAKVIGTVVCLSGAMLLTLYKGRALTKTPHRLTGRDHRVRATADNKGNKKWMLGSIALLAGCFSWSSWFPLQSRVNKKYPSLYSGAAVTFFLSFLQAAILSLATQRDFMRKALKSKVEILTVVYSGVAGSGLGFVAMSWCVEKRGPVFVAAFSPVIQIFVAIIDITILHEQLHVGSILGSAVVICGLYILLWGKSKEPQGCSVKQELENGESGSQQG